MQGSPPPRSGKTDKAYIYPFLFSLYPVLFLYLRNIREVLPAQALLALGVALAIAVFFWIVLRWTVRLPGQRSLLLFLFLLLFHGYGFCYDLILGLLPAASPPLQAHAIAFILPGGSWLLLSLAIVRSSKKFTKLNQVLQLAVILLVTWNMAGILMHQGRAYFKRNRPQWEDKHLADNRAARPDIYCFVLDEFASLESARSLFQYDHPAFAGTLHRQGFFIARNSRSRFRLTEPAMAAIFNLGEFIDGADPFALVRRNTVAAFLKQRGYRIVEFTVEPALFMEAADQRFHYSLTEASIFFNDFYRILFERSLLRILPDLWQRQKTDFSHFYRDRVLTVFEKLPAVIKSPGPKFVFVHLFCPHEPFVFDAQGGPVNDAHWWDHDDPGYYLQQYKFISAKMTETAALILENSTRPPVIIIQSDHGYRGSLRRGKGQRPVAWAEIIKVFNALYLPGIDPGQIAPNLSPLNNFRLIFNHYFGEHYPLLKNP
jgi:hypothetical protein